MKQLIVPLSFKCAAGNLLLVIALLCISSALAGCAIMGQQQEDQPISANDVSQIKVGMTRNKVTDVLGAPQELIFSNKEHDPLREHAYVYEYTRKAGTAIFFLVVNFGNLDTKRDRVVVFFDENGKVSNVGASLHGDDAHFGFPFGK